MPAKSEAMPQVHPIPPLFDKNSRVLILGSFPSVKSKEAKFFYGHPQNRFWRVMAAICGEEPPTCREECRALALLHHFVVTDDIELHVGCHYGNTVDFFIGKEAVGYFDDALLA